MLQRYSIHLYIICFYAAQASFGPYLSYWFMQQGLNNQEIGLISTIGPIVGLAAQPLWGMLSDRLNAEKRVLMLSLALTPAFAFGYLIFGGSFLLLLLTSLLYAVFYTSITPLSDAMTVQHANRHGQSYGSIRVLGSISFAIAVTPLGLLYDRSGLHLMFIVYFIMMLAAIVGLAPADAARPSDQHATRFLTGIGEFLRRRSFLIFLLLVLLIAIGNHANNVFFSVYIGHLEGEAEGRIGLLNTIAALSELPFFLMSAYLIRRFGYFSLLTVTALAGALRWGLLALMPPFPLLIVSQLLHGLTFAMLTAAGVTYAYAISPKGLKNTGQTLFAVVNYNIATLIAANLGGWLIDYRGFTDLYTYTSILSVIAAAGFYLLWRSERRKRR